MEKKKKRKKVFALYLRVYAYGEIEAVTTINFLAPKLILIRPFVTRVSAP